MIMVAVVGFMCAFAPVLRAAQPVRHLRPADRADFPDRLYCSDLIVRVHDGYQTGIVPDGHRHFFGTDQAVFVHVQKSNIEAFFLKSFQSVQDSMVFKC